LFAEFIQRLSTVHQQMRNETEENTLMFSRYVRRIWRRLRHIFEIIDSQIEIDADWGEEEDNGEQLNNYHNN
jgi:two-component sensor histidine kinase